MYVYVDIFSLSILSKRNGLGRLRCHRVLFLTINVEIIISMQTRCRNYSPCLFHGSFFLDVSECPISYIVDLDTESGCSCAEGSIRYPRRVVQEDGILLTNTTMIMQNTKFSSDRNGMFEICVRPGEKLMVTVVKEGFVSATVPADSEDDIVLTSGKITERTKTIIYVYLKI